MWRYGGVVDYRRSPPRCVQRWRRSPPRCVRRWCAGFGLRFPGRVTLVGTGAIILPQKLNLWQVRTSCDDEIFIFYICVSIAVGVRERARSKCQGLTKSARGDYARPPTETANSATHCAGRRLLKEALIQDTYPDASCCSCACFTHQKRNAGTWTLVGFETRKILPGCVTLRMLVLYTPNTSHLYSVSFADFFFSKRTLFAKSYRGLEHQKSMMTKYLRTRYGHPHSK